MSPYNNQLDSYPPSKNRLLVIDWASLSYHQLFALSSKSRKTSYFEMDTPEKELYAWNTNMVSRLLKYIQIFNPKDIVLTLEGNDVWRNDFCKEYYEKHCTVYYDKTGYYVRFDNFLYHFFKDGDKIGHKKLDVVKDLDGIPEKSKKLKDLPDRIQKILWDTVLPKYKGQRAKQTYWPFLTPKSTWKKYKESFTQNISKAFRVHVIGQNDAEGDDVIYVAVNYWKKKYDSIILITGDSDMHQLLTQDNLEILDHKKGEMVECPYPKDVLEIKVLSGDKSDNINGMALPNKKTQLGAAGARKLFETEGNIYQKAIDEDWGHQYIRNQKMIDLTNIPTHIQRELCKQLDESKPVFGSLIESRSINVTEKIYKEIEKTKNLGYYALNSLKAVEENPELFDESLFTNKEEEDTIDTVAPVRKFEDVGKVFDDPLSEEEVDVF